VLDFLISSTVHTCQVNEFICTADGGPCLNLIESFPKGDRNCLNSSFSCCRTKVQPQESTSPGDRNFGHERCRPSALIPANASSSRTSGRVRSSASVSEIVIRSTV